MFRSLTSLNEVNGPFQNFIATSANPSNRRFDWNIRLNPDTLLLDFAVNPYSPRLLTTSYLSE